MISRRNLIAGITALIAAPAVIRVADIMLVKRVPFRPYIHLYQYNSNNERINESFYYMDVKTNEEAKETHIKILNESNKLNSCGRAIAEDHWRDGLPKQECFFRVVDYRYEFTTLDSMDFPDKPTSGYIRRIV